MNSRLLVAACLLAGCRFDVEDADDTGEAFVDLAGVPLIYTGGSSPGDDDDDATAASSSVLYAVNLYNGTFTFPPDALGFVESVFVFVRVDGLGTDTLSMHIQAGMPETFPPQIDACAAPLTVTGVAHADDWGIDRDVGDVTMEGWRTVVDIYSFEMHGWLNEEAGRVGVSGTVDIGGLDWAFDGDSCTMVKWFGFTCHACPDGGDTCVTGKLDQLPLVPVEDPPTGCY